VDILVNKGLVIRQQDPADRRNIPLALTAEGQRVIAAIYDETERWLADRFKRLSEAELESLLQSLDLIRQVFID
jgi:DNA-binding MarR family transcriptional regulator